MHIIQSNYFKAEIFCSRQGKFNLEKLCKHAFSLRNAVSPQNFYHEIWKSGLTAKSSPSKYLGYTIVSYKHVIYFGFVKLRNNNMYATSYIYLCI